MIEKNGWQKMNQNHPGRITPQISKNKVLEIRGDIQEKNFQLIVY